MINSSHLPRDSAIAIVIPIFDDEPSLRKLMEHVQDVMLRAGLSAHLVIVDDGSSRPVDAESLRACVAFPLHVIYLRRNVGHQRAIAIGLSHVVATELAATMVVMDADGEDQPTDIPKLVSTLAAADQATIVVAKRANRSEGMLFKICYRAYQTLFRLLTGDQIKFGNYSVMRIEAAKRLCAMPELWINLPAAVLRSRLAFCYVATDRGRRYFGQSKMNLVSLVQHAFSAIAVFADRVLTRLTLAAVAAVVLTSIASFLAIAMKIAGLASPGWMTSVIATSLVVTLIACMLGVIGLLTSLSGGVLFLPQPIASYQSFIAAIVSSERGLAQTSSVAR
jgi:polyisoprenyl-phosphate glycosyltransferase